MMRIFFLAISLLMTYPCFSMEEDVCSDRVRCEVERIKKRCEKRWYLEFKPGYFYFTDADMREFFDNGGFSFRGETGCKLWGPLTVWVDGGYFQKKGEAIGGTEKLEIKLASITLGLKLIHYFHKSVAIYAGAGPRLVMMMLKNHSEHVNEEDNEFGIGGGFDAGIWIFPLPNAARNLFFDLFVDYSWKKMSITPDPISSYDHDVDVSGLTAGLGIGFRF